jgi:hypothetical protein
MTPKEIAEVQTTIAELQTVADGFGAEGLHGAAHAIAVARQLARSMLMGRLAAERTAQEAEKEK